MNRRPAGPLQRAALARAGAPPTPAPHALEEGLIRAGFLPPLPRGVRLARRVRRGLAGRLAPRGGPPRRNTRERAA